MPQRREVPFDPSIPAPHGPQVACSAAETPLAALMETPPFADTQLSREELLPLRDVIEDAVDTALDDRERWVFNASIVERKSFSAIAAELALSKSHTHRLKDRALRKLRVALQREPMIVEYLERTAA